MNPFAWTQGGVKFDTGALAPILVAAAVGCTLVALAYARGLRRPPRFGRRLLAGLRLAAVAAVALSLLHPVRVRETDAREKPDLAVVVDTSASMAAASGSAEGAPGRYTRALEVLRKDLLPRFAERFRVQVYDVNGVLTEPDRLPEAPEADASPLTQTLAGIQRSRPSGRLRAVALLSDGREVAGETDRGDPSALRVPVYPIEIAPPAATESGTCDLSVQAVVANDEAIVGNAVKVDVLLAARGDLAERLADVRIYDGELPVARQTIRWGKGERSRTASLHFVPKRAGEYQFAVHACHAKGTEGGEPPSDPDLGNNWSDFPLRVRPEPLTVLYVDGVLRWEGKFVRQALDEDPDVNLLSAVRTTPREAGSRSEGLLTAAQLANVNVVIVGDVEPQFFGEGELVALREWVTTSGGGLLLTGGYLSFGPNGFGNSAIGSILPTVFAESEPLQIEAPFNMKLTEDGFHHPIFHVTGDKVKDRSIWHSLPKLAGCSRIESIKPGARVLAVNPERTQGDDKRGLPILVEQQVGKGRAMVFAVDSTWQWRTIVGGFTGRTSFYQKLWGQIVRYLASREEALEGGRLHVSTDREVYAVHDAIEVSVELVSASKASAGGESDADAYRVQGVVTDEAGSRRALELAAVGRDRYQGRVPAEKAGRILIAVSAEPVQQDPRRVCRSRLAQVRIRHPNRERSDLRPDPAWLDRVAQLTGGRVLKSEDVAAWNVDASEVQEKKVEMSGLWHHPAGIAALFVVLCAEWILRRLGRLA